MAPDNSFDQVPKGTWQDLVQFAQRHGSNVTVEQFKDRYDSAVENFRREPSYKPVLTRPRNEPQPDENGYLDFGPYEVGFGGIATAGVRGSSAEVTTGRSPPTPTSRCSDFRSGRPGSGLFGRRSEHHLRHRLEGRQGADQRGHRPDGDRYCLRITGKISVWIPFSWHDFNVDWEPVCF